MRPPKKKWVLIEDAFAKLLQFAAGPASTPAQQVDRYKAAREAIKALSEHIYTSEESD